MTNKDTIKEVMEEFDEEYGMFRAVENELNYKFEDLEQWLTSKLQEVFEQGRKEGVEMAIALKPKIFEDKYGLATTFLTFQDGIDVYKMELKKKLSSLIKLL